MLDQVLSVLASSIIVLYAIYTVSISDRIGSSDIDPDLADDPGWDYSLSPGDPHHGAAA